MKNQHINISFIILTFIIFLLSAIEAKGQEVLYNNNQPPNEDLLKSSYIFDTGLKKIRMPVNRNIDNSSLTKSETIKSSESWDIQRVHNGKLFSEMSDRSLALDANGMPHIAYGQTHLYYAWYDEEWHIETVDNSWDVGMDASLALDSDGHPHISYYDRDPNGDLKYAFKDENGWHITTVDDGGDDGSVGVYTSIALDANNHPHISYHDLTNGNLKYTQWDGSQWQIETIDSEGYVGEFNSLALDQNGAPHISYYDWTNGNLKYAHWDGSEWQIITVDDDWVVGLFTSIALDNNDQPHISYFDYTNGNLKYAVRIGDQWNISTVDNGGSFVGLYSSLAIDDNGNPHIGYFVYEGVKLRYAFFNGNEWKIKNLSSVSYPPGYVSPADGYEGLFTSLALDADGHPHISHLGSDKIGASRSGLRFHYYDGTDWHRGIKVDYYLDFKHTSLAIDNTNNPHIGYVRSDFAMGYTTWDENNWLFDTFYPEVGVVSFSDETSSRFLAVDANNQPHMIKQMHRYKIEGSIDPGYPSLIYSWYENDGWCNDTVMYSHGFSDIRTSSLVLDQFDMPHISNYSINNDNLKYFFQNGNQWYESIVDTGFSGDFPGVPLSIAIDSEGFPHISYKKSGLWYARLVNHEWDLQIVDADGSGDYNSLKLDADNFPHISYYNETDKALQFAYWTGIEWNIETVDNNGDVGKYSSLDLDTDSFPHISYYDETNGNLKYAYWDGSQWQIEIVDSYRTVGLYTSLALDANDNRHISYYDASFGDLKYASKRALETNLTIVASAGDNGSIVPSGEIEVEYGHDQVFNINPDEGFRIAFIKINETEIDLEIDENWDAENGQYIFSNVTKDHTIEVGFIVNTYTISATPNNESYGTVTGGGEYDHFDQVTLTATPATGYHFVNWTENGEVVSDSLTYTFTAEEDRNLVAHFAINTYLITATAGENGSISPEGNTEVEHGSELVLTITPDDGFRIAFIRIDGAEIDLDTDESWDAENGQYIFSEVTGAHTIEVGFEVATALAEAETRQQLTVYPNPAKEELWVAFDHQGDAEVDLVLLNIHGQVVQQVSVSASGPVRQRMATHGLTPGVYLLTIRSGEVFPVKKVVIEN